MENKKIKYALLQPLTGGAAIGTKNAVGHNAEFIISYPGFDSCSKNSDGDVVRASNEYHLLKYLEKKNESVPYYQFDRAPFQDGMDMNPKFIHNGNESAHPDYTDLDLVVAVPVCSGLSTATVGNAETKRTRNNNMLYLANYALRVMQPKIYIFENAPTFMGHAGSAVREELEKLAQETNYSICYYKTDTLLHDNCQRRPRTFIYFFKADGDRKGAPQIGFENKTVTIEEFLNRIPENATQQIQVPMGDICDTILDYVHSYYGENWRDNVRISTLIDDFIKQDKLDDWGEKVASNPKYSDKQKERVLNYIKHIRKKTDECKGFWKVSPSILRKPQLPAAMHKTINTVLHHNEDRCYTVREWLSTMGMPYDFEMQGIYPINYYKQIGQNVPARTMQFIASEAVRILNNWDSVERNNTLNVLFCDNTKQESKILKEM